MRDLNALEPSMRVRRLTSTFLGCRGFKCKGVCYILLGVVINLPWMAFLYLTADTVEYQPSE